MYRYDMLAFAIRLTADFQTTCWAQRNTAALRCSFARTHYNKEYQTWTIVHMHKLVMAAIAREALMKAIHEQVMKRAKEKKQ